MTVGESDSVGTIDDFLKVLDRIPIWKRLGEVPTEVDDLKRRLSELEGKLNGKWPADICKFCGERAVRMTANFGPNEKGKMHQNWSCGACNKVEMRIV
jgi:hypothetical protein